MNKNTNGTNNRILTQPTRKNIPINVENMTIASNIAGGSILSMQPVSLENLFKTLPAGFWSKKSNGALSRAANIWLCRLTDEFMHINEKGTVLIKEKKNSPTTRPVYTCTPVFVSRLSNQLPTVTLVSWLVKPSTVRVSLNKTVPFSVVFDQVTGSFLDLRSSALVHTDSQKSAPVNRSCPTMTLRTITKR